MNFKEAQVEKTEDDDRISALPDGLLCHILSFLPTKYAVATTILSTRWKYLFTWLPDLDLDDTLLSCPEDGIDVDRFTNFVYRVLLLRKTWHINRFRLLCCEQYDVSHVNAWICSALWRNLKELDVSFYAEEFGMLSSDIFTCRTLAFLKIVGILILKVPFSVCLPNLKILHLCCLKLADDDSIRRIFSGCPMLEELELRKCTLENVEMLHISIPSLKSLALQYCRGNYQIVLDATILGYFKYHGIVAGGYLVKNLKSLVKAHLSVWLTRDQMEEASLHYGYFVEKLVNEISGIKFLHLSDLTLEAIDCSHCSLPTFHNLTHLELGVNINGWQLLPDLLDSSPNLEVLDFVEGFLEHTADEWNLHCRLPERVPICLSQCLKEIVVREFGRCEDELKLIEYFLSRGKVLKKITINTNIFQSWPSSICRRLFVFPKCSKTCQIVLGTCQDNEYRLWTAEGEKTKVLLDESLCLE
ncbi:LOW protein: F-box/FBD/LRR-like protein [Actinidia rufa]|uniref:LOW protein: F-box/FBD/LRR-like protein n=1 Tax=Actinidia rufa TaxID=165716 RepID=A0A7J0FVB9_9ERIC|nr:LOW protein: F-box/FBD/LRR-like protein [Actinidia rufa]